MANPQTEYSDYEYNALGHFLRQQMFGVELTEQEQIEAAMAILKFGEIEIPKVKDELQSIEINEKWGIISKDGWIAFPIYDYVGYFTKGFAWVQRADGTYNFINTKGELYLTNGGGMFGISMKISPGVQRVEDGKWNYINIKGEFLSEEWWEEAGGFAEGFARVQRAKDGKCNHINTKGEFLSEEWWEDVWYFIEGFAMVERADGKENHINTKGEILSKEWWVGAGYFDKGFAWVKRTDETEGYIDKQGKFYDKRPN